MLYMTHVHYDGNINP